ncbi:MAG: ferritin-like domain-containing protein [Burkholderiales bacterium]|nr:ferritin-like domain-containing protein [Burkholderiales bacterium]
MAEQHTSLRLDEAGLKAARGDLADGAVTPAYGPWRDDIVALLNGALATELTCVLRYRRHHFMANGLESPTIAGEFLVHANAELGHADRLAQRIVQLGGEPDFNPVGLLERGHAGYDEINDLKGMIKSNLIAERVAVESYRQMIGLVADKDSTTRRLLEDILADEEEHADELKDWMTRA